jgi:hemerythrin-like domain-containing protein
MKATQPLREEHEGVLVMLSILEKVGDRLAATGSLDPNHFAAILDFLKGFVDRCHHAKEEEGLFPALVAAGVPQERGPVGVMLAEHEQGRGHIRAMGEAFAAWQAGETAATGRLLQHGRDYTALLRAHIAKENEVLFAMADRLLAPATEASLLEAFEKIEAERVGPGGHEGYHHRLEELATVYEV